MFVATLFLALRLTSLQTDISNSDAYRWHRRSENFLTAIKSHNFKETYQSYHPGVTLMWINSLVLQLSKSYNYRFAEDFSELTFENSSYYPFIQQISKGSIVIFLFILFSYQLIIVSKLYDQRTSLLYGLLIACEPYLVGLDRWFHLSSLETYLAFSGFLTIWYWKKFGGTFYVVLSGLLIGLAVLTKVTNLVALIPCIFVIISRFFSFKSGFRFKRFLNLGVDLDARSIIKSVAYFLISFMLTVVVFFPALPAHPLFVITKVLGGITGGIYTDVRETPFSGAFSMFYYPFILFLKLSPLSAFLSIWVFAVAIFSKNNIKKYAWLLLYVATYFFALSISVKKIDRYSIALILPILLITSIYFANSKVKAGLIACTTLLFTFIIFYIYHPSYSAFYSPILGPNPSAKALSLNVYDNSGEYYSDAALYLNKIPVEGDLWLPYNIDSFRPYYKRVVSSFYSKDSQYAVTSIEHLEEISALCPRHVSSFGSRLEPLVFVLRCN